MTRMAAKKGLRFPRKSSIFRGTKVSQISHFGPVRPKYPPLRSGSTEVPFQSARFGWRHFHFGPVRPKTLLFRPGSAEDRSTSVRFGWKIFVFCAAKPHEYKYPHSLFHSVYHFKILSSPLKFSQAQVNILKSIPRFRSDTHPQPATYID